MAGDGRPPRPTPSKNRRRAILHDAARPASTTTGAVLHGQLASDTSLLFPDNPPRAFHQLTLPLDLNAAWDSQSTASAPLLGHDTDDDLSPSRSPLFDWTLSPTLSVDNTSNDPIGSQSFMNLLTQDVDPDVEVLMQLPAPRATKRGSNYSHDEGIQLCESWINVTHDPIAGTEQPGKTYWKRITKNYNDNKNLNLNERTASSLEHRWGIIQKECLKFQGYFEEVERRHPSGIPYNDYLMEAQARYSGSDPKGKTFPFVHCWLKVRHREKFVSLYETMKE